MFGLVGLLIFIAAYMGMAALIHLRNIPAIVVTLGAQFVWYGIALILCPTPGGSCPEMISNFFKLKNAGYPVTNHYCSISRTGMLDDSVQNKIWHGHERNWK